jgi:hypothetical protein
MALAGEYALSAAAERGDISFSTAATHAARWTNFARFAGGRGITKMENVSRELVSEFGRVLASQVRNSEVSASHAQNLVSCVNSVMKVARGPDWRAVRPVHDCGIAQRSAVRDTRPPDRAAYDRALADVRERVGERAAAVVGLAREFGLRAKEASLIDARRACAEACMRGAIVVSNGTKGGRARAVPITEPGRQLEALRAAAAAQGRDRSMIPSSQSWAKWLHGELRAARDVVHEHIGGGIRDLRASYACERYEARTGCLAPVHTGGVMTASRPADAKAREIIAAELGHGRAAIAAAYLGGRGRR